MMVNRPRVRVLFRPDSLFSAGFPWVWMCEACERDPDLWARTHWRTLPDCRTDASAHARVCPAIRHFTLIDHLEALRDNLAANCRRQELNREQLGHMPPPGDFTRAAESDLVEWIKGAEFVYKVVIDKIDQLITDARAYASKQVTW